MNLTDFFPFSGSGEESFADRLPVLWASVPHILFS